MREDLWKEEKVPVNTSRKMRMEAANGSMSELPGCAKMLEIDVDGLKTWAHAFIVPTAPYPLLLWRPCIILSSYRKKKPRNQYWLPFMTHAIHQIFGCELRQ